MHRQSCFLITTAFLATAVATAQNQPAAGNHTSLEVQDKRGLSVTANKAAADPCARLKALTENLNRFSRTAVFKASLSSLTDSLIRDSGREYVVSFGFSAEDELLSSPVVNGGTSSGVLPSVAGAFADLHNHPRHTPPSSGDVYGLLRKHQKDSRYCLRFVLNKMALYALAITDSTAAALFLQRYPPQQVAGFSPLFPDALLDEYRYLISEQNKPEELVMARLLENYDTGMVLLKKEGSEGFKKLSFPRTGSTGSAPFAGADCGY